MLALSMLPLAEDRKKTSLDRCWTMLTQQHEESIEAVAMDTGDPIYRFGSQEGAKAVIAFEGFHNQHVFNSRGLKRVIHTIQLFSGREKIDCLCRLGP
jgi:predicted Zn-dependent protease with MMP-like domain